MGPAGEIPEDAASKRRASSISGAMAMHHDGLFRDLVACCELLPDHHRREIDRISFSHEMTPLDSKDINSHADLLQPNFDLLRGPPTAD